ncbi:DNA mismatch repair endonuclease MutL [Brevibacillus dissolubilis]|uniref:DNA mismatch repair endonuclease MutL n=1 Tax=Brevibacillus dissolubilis TaxID=1844116 RepID=UPI001116FEE4|nr:DNA mismatch repair endonuclease MutL [Brevibacillus dissolubilis]
MGKIQILDDHLSNMIAAGEVVERPASVVKELVENAVDAGATKVEIHIEEGGLNSIRIVDNGYGMDREDCVNAFERHATSKIRMARDLFHIRTLGFRGEALPSIASVSRMELKSSESSGEVGTRVLIEGGKIKSVEDLATVQGTEITVSDLFFNTPARLKYMKSISTEVGHVSDYVNRLALTYPQIAFTLTHNSKNLLQTSGDGKLLHVIAAIYGVQVAKLLIPFEGETLDFKWSGFLSKTEVTRANRTYISTLINGRYVRHYALTNAVMRGYHTFLPVGRFPIVALHVEMDPILVDVNVHPAKLEVRFSKEQELCQAIEESVKTALRQGLKVIQPLHAEKRPKITLQRVEQPQFDLGTVSGQMQMEPSPAPIYGKPSIGQSPVYGKPGIGQSTSASARVRELWDAPSYLTPSMAAEDEEGRISSLLKTEAGSVGTSAGSTEDHLLPASMAKVPSDNGTVALVHPDELQSQRFQLDDNHDRIGSTGSAGFEQAGNQVSSDSLLEGSALKEKPSGSTMDGVPKVENLPESTFVGSSTPTAQFQDHADVSTMPADPSQSSADTSSSTTAETSSDQSSNGVPIFYPVGQVHGTYIIAQNDTGMYLVDQHAAQERIFYEFFMQKLSEQDVTSQMLLFPHTIECTTQEEGKLIKRLDMLQSFGLEIEWFGNRSFIVRAHPHWFPEGSEIEVIDELVQFVLEASESETVDLINMREKAAIMMSCKASIKANRYLTHAEMEALLNRLRLTTSPFTCPHGRPIVIHFTTYDLEKMFKRVM